MDKGFVRSEAAPEGIVFCGFENVGRFSGREKMNALGGGWGVYDA